MAKQFLDKDGLDALWARICLLIPDKNGTGATGEWGISITGNAASASALANFTSHVGSISGGVDCNAITSNGIWYWTANGPSQALGNGYIDGALYSAAYNSTWAAQIAQCYRNGRLFTRGKSQENNGWSSWQAVAYIGDAPTSHTHDYLPLSGGTLTGEVQFNISGLEQSDICSGVIAAFKAPRIQATDLICNTITLGASSGSSSNLPLTIRKYSAIANTNPSGITDLVNISTDGIVDIASTLRARNFLRIDTTDYAGNYGYLKPETYVRTVNTNRAVLRIGSNYGSNTNISLGAEAIDAINIYRGVVGIGGTFTGDDLYDQQKAGVSLAVAGNMTVNGVPVSLDGHTHGYWTWNENTIKDVKVNNAGNADYAGTATYASTTGYASSAGYAATAGRAATAVSASRAIYAASAGYAATAGRASRAIYAASAGYATTAQLWDGAGSTSDLINSAYSIDNMPNINGFVESAAISDGDLPSEEGVIAQFGDIANNKATQLFATTYINDYDCQLFFRTNDGAPGWHPWLELIHSANINGQSVGYATTAGNAVTAERALYAVTANRAQYATTAGHARIANNANSAGSAVTADYAITASKAGYAVTADRTLYASSAGYAANTAYASSAGIANYVRTNQSTSTFYIVGTTTSASATTGYPLIKSSAVKVQSNAVYASAGFYESSDARLKTITSDVEVDFERLKSIPKIQYIKKGETAPHIGTIAQDLQKVYPEFVETGEDGYMSVDYAKLSIIPLKAVDLLYDEVNKLKDEIKTVKEENQMLKDRLDSIEAIINK